MRIEKRSKVLFLNREAILTALGIHKPEDVSKDNLLVTSYLDAFRPLEEPLCRQNDEDKGEQKK
jgi:hypothetical protein